MGSAVPQKLTNFRKISKIPPGLLNRGSRNEIFRVPTGFVGKIIGRNFYNRESLVKNQRERRTLGSVLWGFLYQISEVGEKKSAVL